MAINTGVNVSKLVGYAVPLPATGLDLYKLVGYAVFQNANVTAPAWPAFTFAGGVVGVAYAQSFDLAPAAPPTTYTVVSGSLPTGLSLSDVSDDIGSISGTPTAAGTFSFTLRASSAYGTADKAFTLTVTVHGRLIVHPGMSGGMRG